MTIGWVALGLAVAVPATLIAAVPRRWLGRAVFAWVTLPVTGYAGAIAWEMLTRPPQPNALGNAFYGLMLISPLVVVPWLAVCLAGLGLGLGIRRLSRPTPRLQAAPRAPAAVRTDPPAAVADRARPEEAPEETPGWRHVHIGFEGDALRIGGLAVWKHDWRPTGGPPVLLPHPAHPLQTHAYHAFAIGPETRQVRFAAGELSNGVWGFSVRWDDPVEARGTSQDGSLLYEHRLGQFVGGRYDEESPWAVLIDAADGRVLADCAAWEVSRILPGPDGALFLRLRQNAFDVLFRIDPAARTFNDYGERGPDRPLADLAGAVAEARRATDGRPAPPYRHIAPNGAIRVDLDPIEWSNAHWVNAPRVTDLVAGRTVLDLWGTDWDATVSFPGARRVRLGLRRYRQGAPPAVELDLARDIYRIDAGTGGGDTAVAGPLTEVADALEEASRRVVAASAGATPRREAAPKPWAAWRAALLILAGALTAIAGASFVSLRLGASGGRPSVPLATVPQPEGQALRPR